MYDDKGLSYKIVNDNSVIEFSKSKIYNEIINFIMNLNESIIAVEMKPLECFVACDNSRGTNLGNNNNGGNNGNSNNNDSDKGKLRLTLSKNVYNIFELIKNINTCIDSCPPIKQPARFGNKGFQNFCDAYYKEINTQLPTILIES
ncbi:serine/threonine protein phosphatase 2A activator, partial [Hepatocystis sp. ex Piliocolobus tephrosceles]